MTLGAARRPKFALPHGHISLMPVCTHPVLHLATPPPSPNVAGRSAGMSTRAPRPLSPTAVTRCSGRDAARGAWDVARARHRCGLKGFWGGPEAGIAKGCVSHTGARPCAWQPSEAGVLPAPALPPEHSKACRNHFPRTGRMVGFSAMRPLVRDEVEGQGPPERGPAAVRRAVGGGCQSGLGRLLSVTNATEAGTGRRGDCGLSIGRALWRGGGVTPTPLLMHPWRGGGDASPPCNASLPSGDTSRWPATSETAATSRTAHCHQDLRAGALVAGGVWCTTYTPPHVIRAPSRAISPQRLAAGR